MNELLQVIILLPNRSRKWAIDFRWDVVRIFRANLNFDNEFNKAKY